MLSRVILKLGKFAFEEGNVGKGGEEWVGSA